jgi:DNA-binding transcriptional LysR family regulator
MLGARGDVSVQVSGNLRANDGDALRAAAIAGQGSDLPATFIVADDLRTGILVALTLDQWTVELAGIHAVSCRTAIRLQKCARSSTWSWRDLHPTRPGMMTLLA